MRETKEFYCYYCGLPASTVDHVIPQTILKLLLPDQINVRTLPPLIRGRILTVACCQECNSLLGPKYQGTIKLRKAFLKTRLKKKYKKILKMPNWTKTEIKELGYTLQQAITTAMEIKTITLKRLRW